MTSNHNERLERHIVEEDEEKLEEIVKSMKLSGRTHEQICHFLSKKAEQYLKFLDMYCNEKKCNEYKKEDGE